MNTEFEQRNLWRPEVDGSRPLWRRQAGCGSRPKYVRSSGSVTWCHLQHNFLQKHLFLEETRS